MRCSPPPLAMPPAREKGGRGVGEEWSGRDGKSEVGGRQWAEGREGYRAQCIFVCGLVTKHA